MFVRHFLSVCCCLAFLLPARGATRDDFHQAAEQLVSKAHVLCKIAVYHRTAQEDTVAETRFPDGTALVKTTVLVEAVVLESYKGACRAGDFIVYQTGGVERGKIPDKKITVDPSRELLYVEADSMRPTPDGRLELIDAVVLPRIPEAYIPAVEAVLKEQGFSPASTNREKLAPEKKPDSALPAAPGNRAAPGGDARK